MKCDLWFPHSCVDQQFYPNGLWRKANGCVCFVRRHLQNQSEHNLCFSVKGNTCNLFSLTVWIKTFQQDYISVAFTLYLACSYSLAYLKKHCQLRVQNMNKPSCMFLWRCSSSSLPTAWRAETPAGVWSCMPWANALLFQTDDIFLNWSH